MKRRIEITIINPFSDLNIRFRCFRQRIRYWLVSRLLTRSEKEKMLTMLEDAKDICTARAMEKKSSEFYNYGRHLEIDIFKQELSKVW